jgi:GNAT superfamily N-acetyltransferase
VSGSDVEVIPADYSDKGVLRRLVELYCYDFSEFDGQDLDAHGTYGYRYLDHFWTEDDRFPFLFRVAEAWAGFALVRAGPPHSIAEFFVLRKYRRAGGARALLASCSRAFLGSGRFTNFTPTWMPLRSGGLPSHMSSPKRQTRRA